MQWPTRILCLANSWKHGERCIAGIDVFTGNWVRPVTDLDDGRVPKPVRLVEGAEPALLDLLDIPLAETGPDFGFECENRRILPGPWRRVGQASPIDLVRFCPRSGLILHNTARTVRKSYLESLPIERRTSLALVRTASFSVAPGAERETGGHKWEGTLETRDGNHLTATITDPVFVARLEAGYRPGDQCFVVVSLSMPYPGEAGGGADVCWKLIAGVIDLCPVIRRFSSGLSDSVETTWPKPVVFAARGSGPIWLSDDGQQLVAGTEPRAENVSTMSHPLRGLTVWDVAGRKKVGTVEFAGEPSGPAAIRSDGALVGRQCGSTVQILDRRHNGRETTLTRLERTVTALVFLPRTDVLVIASSEATTTGLRDPAIAGWNVGRRRVLHPLELPALTSSHPIGVTSLAGSFDGARIAGVVGCRECDIVCLWDASGKLLQSVSATEELGGLGTVSCLAFHPSEPLLAVGSWDGSVTVWDTGSWSLSHVFHGPTRSIVDAVAFSPGGRWFAFGTGSHPGFGNVFERDGAVLCDWPGRREVAVLGHHDVVSGLTFSADESTLATFSIDGVVKAWGLTQYGEGR
jgi:WD40 repeat protein